MEKEETEKTKSLEGTRTRDGSKESRNKTEHWARGSNSIGNAGIEKNIRRTIQ